MMLLKKGRRSFFSIHKSSSIHDCRITGKLNKYCRFALKCFQLMPLGQKTLFLMQRKRFSVGNDWRGKCSRCSVKVSACEQVLPTVIQMAAPQHRQWVAPWGDRYHANTCTVNLECNLHELVGGSWICG